MNTIFDKAVAEQQASQERILLEQVRIDKLNAYIEAEKKAAALAEELGLTDTVANRSVEKKHVCNQHL